MISIIVGEQERLSKIYTWSWPDFIKTLKLTLCIFIGGFLTIKYILPFVLFSVRRFTTYLSLIFFCIFHKCRFKIKKVPFTSLRGISENCDIEIITDSKIFCIHFIDIPFRFKRAFIIMDDKQYSISKTMPLKLGWLGAGGRFIKGGIRFLLGTGHTITPSYITTGHIITKEKIFDIPHLSSYTNHQHIFLTEAVPVESSFLKSDAKLSTLTSGEKIGSVTFYYKKAFMNHLKNCL